MQNLVRGKTISPKKTEKISASKEGEKRVKKEKEGKIKGKEGKDVKKGHKLKRTSGLAVERRDTVLKWNGEKNQYPGRIYTPGDQCFIFVYIMKY